MHLARASSTCRVINHSLASHVRYIPTNGTCSAFKTFAILKYWLTSHVMFSRVLELHLPSKGVGLRTRTPDTISRTLGKTWLDSLRKLTSPINVDNSGMMASSLRGVSRLLARISAYLLQRDIHWTLPCLPLSHHLVTQWLVGISSFASQGGRVAPLFEAFLLFW